MRPTGPPASRPSGRRAPELGAAAARSTTASTSSPTGTRSRATTPTTGGLVENALDNVADWIGAGIDPEKSTLFVQSLVPGARRAVPAAADGHADPVARARADLQGADGAARREGPVEPRLPRLSAAADRRRHHLQRALRAGRRGSGAAPRAVARGRAALPQFLRRGVRRAAAAAHADAAPAGPRQPEDEQELRQHHRPVGLRPRRS